MVIKAEQASANQALQTELMECQEVDTFCESEHQSHSIVEELVEGVIIADIEEVDNVMDCEGI